ncbi:MAG: UDP-3-O-(3-hydroxymyristoyl)glucosamine N-acyltransferase [Planctomycetes bacterium]|nr:UDP-3-O-(3-hydroxymyristoyl)glucosamine N-acyltransferase [Planctomycetota bacterium]
MEQQITLAALAGLLGGRLTDAARGQAVVRGFRALDAAGPTDLAFLWDPKFLGAARASKAAAIVAKEPVEGAASPTIVVQDPQAAMLVLLGQVHARRHPPEPPGVHPRAFVHPEATLGEGVSVGPCAVVEAGARIGARTRVRAGAFVGLGVTIGQDCVVHPNATVLDHCVLGDRVVVWSGAIVGKDGFGFVNRGGRHQRVPQIGGVRIEDDVEVGALSTVARGALEDTVLRRGVKIDDHCHVAHNCDLGEDVMLIGYARMGGSVTMGKGSYLLQDAAIGQGLSVGEGGVVGSGAKARYDSVGPGERVLGDPARPHMLMKRIEGTLPRLPDMRRRLRALEKRVAKLDGQGAGDERD